MGNKLRLGSMAALVWLLAACSPYSYSKEISTFSASVDKLSDAYSASFDAIAVARASELQAHALSERSLGNNPKFAISTVCNSSSVPKSGDPEPCALYLRDQPPPKFTDAERNRKPATIALKALKDYVSALAAVTNAQDRSAYDTAVSQLSGAVGTILTPANAVAPGSSVAVSAGITNQSII